MVSRLLAVTAVTLVAFTSSVLAQTNALRTNFTANWNPTGEGCVNTAGYLSCYAEQGTKASSCKSACANANTKGSNAYNGCEDECDKLWAADNIGCWIESCWNQVYSCGYQLTAMAFFAAAGLPQSTNYIPFYPPPDSASAGACSCNLGYVYGNLSAVSTNMQGSSCTVISGGASGDNTTYYDCACCQLSWPISNILTNCPSSDLSFINFPQIISDTANHLKPSKDKCEILSNGSATCVDDYNFPFAGTSAYNPLALPSGVPGKAALSNSAGNPFTTFPFAAGVTLSLLTNHTSTISAVPFTTTASANAMSITGTSIINPKTSTTRSTSTTATATPTATSKSNAAGGKLEAHSALLLSAVGVILSGMVL